MACIIGDYSLQQVISEGTYGRALLCREDKTRKTVVLKEISVEKMANVEKEAVEQEAANLVLMNHPNIVKVERTFFDKKAFYLVNNFTEGITVADLVKGAEGAPFGVGHVLDWFIEICFAVKYLHDRQIMHRNIHSRNVIITTYGVAKLCDVAFAKVIEHSPEYNHANRGTPYNIAPETCLGLEFTYKSDVWALGLLLLELCTTEPVFNGQGMSHVVMRILAGVKPNVPEDYGPEISELVVGMLKREQTERLTIDEVLRSSAVRNRMEIYYAQKVRRIEATEPIRARNSGWQGQKPSLGQKKTAKPRVKDAKSKDPEAKKSKICPGRLGKPEEKPKRLPPPPQDVSGLAVSAVGIDHNAMMVKKVVPKYDIMSSKCSSAASGLRMDDSCQSREDFDRLRVKDIEDRQKEREGERARVMKELSEDAKHRKKSYDKLEAPFKRIRDKAQNPASSEHDEDELLMAVETAKPAPVVGMHFSKATERMRDVDVLVDLIRQRREDVQKSKVARARMRDDVVLIGNTEVAVDLPKSRQSAQRSAQSTQRSVVIERESVDGQEDEEILMLAAIAKNILDIPPGDHEAETVGNFIPSLEAGFFYFTGLPLDIPGIADVESMEERLDCLQQFLEDGLGSEGAESAKICVRKVSLESRDPAELRKVFSNNGLLVYFPFVEHYIFCEQFANP